MGIEKILIYLVTMKNNFKTIALCFIILLASCQTNSTKSDPIASQKSIEAISKSALKENLTQQGFQVFDYVDKESGDTILMQQYFMVFLKSGENRSQSKQELDSLQKLHLAYLGAMYQKGYADISGPFGDDGTIRGVSIYNVPTLEMADSLANADPMVQAGRLKVEVHPWWAAKGYPLR